MSINYVQRIYTGENNRTEYDEIYVFTSYLVGAHEGGAALLVYRKFGAVQQCNCATRDRYYHGMGIKQLKVKSMKIFPSYGHDSNAPLIEKIKEFLSKDAEGNFKHEV